MVRKRIIEEAMELFTRSGVKSTTMDDLARHMGISKRTIYENFKDKEALLIASIGTFYAENRAFSERVFMQADNVIDAVLVLLQKGAEQASMRQFDLLNDIRKYYPQVFKDHLTCHHANKYHEMAQLVQKGIEQGVFRNDLNPEIIAHVFSKQADGIWMADKELDKFALSEVFENMVITFLRGICTPKGIEIIDVYKKKRNL